MRLVYYAPRNMPRENECKSESGRQSNRDNRRRKHVGRGEKKTALGLRQPRKCRIVILHLTLWDLGGFIPAFNPSSRTPPPRRRWIARCRFLVSRSLGERGCIAASLLVFTSPTGSSCAAATVAIKRYQYVLTFLGFSITPHATGINTVRCGLTPEQPTTARAPGCLLSRTSTAGRRTFSRRRP